MNKAFEAIARLQSVMGAALVTGEATLAGWCANAAISPENLLFIAQTCRSILNHTREEQRVAHTGAVAFGDRTLVFREIKDGIFIVYLDSPVNDAVLAWLFDQVTPLLKEEGIDLSVPEPEKARWNG